jgi:hypothetical protein
MSSELKQVTSDRQLTDVGELEQDLVLGEKNSKDLINFLAGKFEACKVGGWSIRKLEAASES